MYPPGTQKPAEAPITGPHRQAERNRVAYTARQAPRASRRHAVRGFARRLRALLASLDFRQLAGPMAMFFLWPPDRAATLSLVHETTAGARPSWILTAT